MSRTVRAAMVLTVTMAMAGGAGDVAAEAPAGLGPGESRYLYGTHDFSVDANGAVAQDVLRAGIDNAAHGYPEDSDNGWILWVVPGGIEGGGGGGCGLCANLTSDGFGVIVRLDWSFGGAGTIPTPGLFPQLATNAASFAAATPTVHVWIIGNEPNLSISWPGGDVITALEYADAYMMARAAIHAEPGHEDDRVLVAAPGPWNVEAGDWRQYYRDVLDAVRGSYDGSAIHAYNHDACPASTTSPLDVSLLTSSALGGNGWYWHFRVFEHFMDDIPPDMRSFPVYLTEANGNVSWSDARDGWLPTAYFVVNDWNLVNPDRVIRALIPYRWEPWDDNPGQCRVFSIRNKPERVNDFSDALALGYRWCDAPGLPPCVGGPAGTDAGVSDGGGAGTDSSTPPPTDGGAPATDAGGGPDKPPSGCHCAVGRAAPSGRAGAAAFVLGLLAVLLVVRCPREYHGG